VFANNLIDSASIDLKKSGYDTLPSLMQELWREDLTLDAVKLLERVGTSSRYDAFDDHQTVWVSAKCHHNRKVVALVNLKGLTCC
jgi:hypothetical protein